MILHIVTYGRLYNLLTDGFRLDLVTLPLKWPMLSVIKPEVPEDAAPLMVPT